MKVHIFLSQPVAITALVHPVSDEVLQLSVDFLESLLSARCLVERSYFEKEMICKNCEQFNLVRNINNENLYGLARQKFDVNRKVAIVKIQ